MTPRRAAYKEIDLDDLPDLDAMKVITLPEVWKVTVTKKGSIRIPVAHYDDVLSHLNRSDD